MYRRRPNKRSSSTVLLRGFGVLLIILAGLWLALYVFDRESVNQPVDINPTEVITHSTDRPDETEIPPGSYSVPPDQPREIVLPSIDARGYIQRVGIDQYNRVAVPSNIHMAGWYNSSAKPGQDGVSLITGHVSGWYQDGVFSQLVDLNEGDLYQVIYGDDSTKTFRVVRVTTLSEEETAKQMLVAEESIDKQLNLVTCDGDYDRDSGQYELRVLVVSEAA